MRRCALLLKLKEERRADSAAFDAWSDASVVLLVISSRTCWRRENESVSSRRLKTSSLESESDDDADGDVEYSSSSEGIRCV